MGTGFLKRKKEAKQLQEQLASMRAKMENLTIEGQAGNGLVRIVVNGDFEIKEVKIKPECVDPQDVDGLQDLIKAAFMDAKKKLDEEQSKGMPQMPMGFPGF